MPQPAKFGTSSTCFSRRFMERSSKYQFVKQWYMSGISRCKDVHMLFLAPQQINIIFITTTTLVRSVAQTNHPRAKEKMRIDMTDEARVLAVLVLKALRISICFHLDTMPRKYLCPNPVVQSSSSRSLIAHCVPCFDWGI